MTDNLQNATVPTTDNAPAAKGAKTTRKHRSREERIAELQAKLEALKSTPDKAVASTNPLYVRLANIRKDLNTRFRQATIDTNGYVNGQNAAQRILPLAERISNLEAKLADYRNRLAQLPTLMESLPAKIAEISALMERAAKGENVEIPEGILTDPNTPSAETIVIESEQTTT